MQWIAYDGPEGRVWMVGRLRIGWSEARETYWMELLDEEGGDTVLDSINVGSTTEPLDEFEDLANASFAWNSGDPDGVDSDIVSWLDSPPLIDQIMEASGRSWSYD